MILSRQDHAPSKPAKLASAFLLFAAFLTLLAAAPAIHAASDPATRAVKQRVAPQYPELAKRMRVSGVVRIAATVEADGSVSATKTVAGNRMLAGAAEDAVHKWKFEPAAQESTVEVEVNFAMAP